jgi:hypothetical protein
MPHDFRVSQQVGEEVEVGSSHLAQAQAFGFKNGIAGLIHHW